MNSPLDSNTTQPPETSIDSLKRQHVPRQLALTLIKTALVVGETRFARRLALAWLTSYPGDLQISLLHGQVLLVEYHNGQARGDSGIKQAISILENLCLADPEYLEAQEALALAYKTAGLEVPGDTVGNILALGGFPAPELPFPSWANQLKQARKALERSNLDMAEQLVHQVLLVNPSSPVAALTHLEIEIQRGLPLPSIRSLSELYHERWSGCLAILLFLADALMDNGESDQAVALIHQVATQDVTSQVVGRLWGPDHPYQVLWPEQLEIPMPQDLAIPAPVMAALGWNQLPAVSTIPEAFNIDINQEVDANEGNPDADAVSGEAPIEDSADESAEFPDVSIEQQQLAEEPSEGELQTLLSKEDIDSLPEPLRTVQTELQRVANRIKRPQLTQGDGRFPVYIIFTSHQGLVDQYGETAATQIDEVMRGLVEVIRARKTWDALLFYADAGYETTTATGTKENWIKPAKSSDPWSLKLALADMDTVLAKRGEMIGAVLIVGGPEVIPFHHLPNPLDDLDVDVPSDNPYSTRDENYFIPEWSIGRVPGGEGSDPGFLLKVLREITERHKEALLAKPWFTRWWDALVERYLPTPARIRPSLGYTAAIWRQASLSVFHPIGESRAMFVSPPVHVNGKQVEDMPRNERLYLHPVRLGYFNLHGLVDAVEWYGQNDPLDTDALVDYPVALRPQDIGGVNGNSNGRHSPQVVFTEACYGAHIINKRVEDAIALKFLASDSQVVVGSTSTAYGSIANPLAAADLLGYAFWNYIADGLPAGEALRRSKIHLAKEMHRRQGYLDGEDQKTLISFVLYGDPLSQPLGKVNGHETVFRSLKPPAQVKTVCDRTDSPQNTRPIPPEVLNYVKHVVEQYLPGMMDAHLELSPEHAGCPGWSHSCPTAQMGSKSHPVSIPDRKVVTLSKQIKNLTSVHRHYARLTLDSQGKLVKLVVSR